MVSAVRDMNDGKAWDAGEIADLENSLAYGNTIEEAAVFLCRSGTIDDLRRKADELGLAYRSAPLPPPVPTRAITAILISPRVFTAVKDAVTVEPVAEFTLKGIGRALGAYNVLAAVSA
jgi:hypothetical protein